ncbi:MAG: serine/threonine protein phosphatase [Ruminococcaceae bacterium]|nr:serine/threonine protein phosphatase [Oscillospiraceae bacterium]
MSLFVIADTHLSLKDPKPMDVFGSRWSCHSEKLAAFWKSTVKADDTVVIAGDISWAMTLEDAKDDLLFLDSLPGKKIILKGNHDYWWSGIGKIHAFFEENSIKSISLLQNGHIPCEDFIICGTRGWYNDPESCKEEDADFKKVSAREALRLRMSLDSVPEAEKREKLVFTHFPIVYGDFVSREMLDILHEYNIKRTFFGHIHGRYALPKSVIFEGVEFSLISADFLDFRVHKVIK